MANPSAPTLTLESKPPAKLNLRLKICGRRDDGYHLLSMLNVPIDLSDDLRIEFFEIDANSAVPAISLDVEIKNKHIDPALASDTTNNLVFKAANRFFEKFAPPFAVKIHLTKKIPAGAGLGGGSSDCAHALRLLSKGFEELKGKTLTDSDRSTIHDLAVSLGADVLFFMQDSPAIVRGVGDEISPISIPDLSGHDTLLVMLPVFSETKAAYQDFQRAHPILGISEDQKLNAFESSFPLHKDTRLLGELVENDLEPQVVNRHKLIGKVLNTLRSVPDAFSGLTGSGSACFIIANRAKKLDFEGISSALFKLDSAIIVERIRILAV